MNSSPSSDIYDLIDLDKLSQEMREKCNQKKQIQNHENFKTLFLAIQQENEKTNSQNDKNPVPEDKNKAGNGFIFQNPPITDFTDVMLSEDVPKDDIIAKDTPNVKKSVRFTSNSRNTRSNTKQAGIKRPHIPRNSVYSPLKLLGDPITPVFKKVKFDDPLQPHKPISKQEPLPPLDWRLNPKNMLRQVFGSLVFNRALQYVNKNRLSNIQVLKSNDDMVSLTSECTGSSNSIYSQICAYNSNGIVKTSCSCPVSINCKHSCALFISHLKIMHPPVHPQSDQTQSQIAPQEIRQEIDKVKTPPTNTHEEIESLHVQLNNLQYDYLNLLSLYLVEKKSHHNSPYDELIHLEE